jgi:hypothetical protein
VTARTWPALVQDGFAVRIVNGFLVVDDIPFVDAAVQVQRGSLLCPLDLSGTTTATPSTHVMCFVGGVPCDKNGLAIDGLVNDGVEKGSAAPELTATCGFSQKPDGGYRDFYEKVTYYAAMITGPAQAIHSDATAYTYKPVQTDEDDGVFLYVDTFSSRAGITELNSLLALEKVVIIGLGGTGAHLLDALAKTPALTIHLYDGDFFRTPLVTSPTHNETRAPDDPRPQTHLRQPGPQIRRRPALRPKNHGPLHTHRHCQHLQRPPLRRARPSRHQPRPTPHNRNGQYNDHRTRTGQNEPTTESTNRVHAVQRGWSRLGSNQRPSACEADALPLSHGTGRRKATRSKGSTMRTSPNAPHASAGTLA